MNEVGKFLAVIVVVAAVGAMGYGAYSLLGDDAPAPTDDGDDTAPVSGIYAMTYTDESGTARTLSAFKGRWLVIDLTGTTCIYCPAQYDELRLLRASVPASSVSVLTVEVWGAEIDEMSDMALEEGILWDWGVDRGGAFANKWGTTVPRIVVIDPQGNVAFEFSPGTTDYEDIQSKISL